MVRTEEERMGVIGKSVVGRSVFGIGYSVFSIRYSVISMILLMLFLVSCAQQDLTQEQRTYQERCLDDGKPWMYMSEMHDGKVVGTPCNGCMPDDNNHICTIAEYELFIQTEGPKDSVSETTE